MPLDRLFGRVLLGLPGSPGDTGRFAPRALTPPAEEPFRGAARPRCSTAGWRLARLPVAAALLLFATAGCATVGPTVETEEVETFERILRAKSARFFVSQHLRLQEVGTRLLRALPAEDRRGQVPSFGFVAGEATDALATAFEAPRHEGLMVLGVIAGGPADRAGLRAGDYLARIGEQAIATPEDLAALTEAKLGDRVPVEVRRGGGVVEAWVELEHLPWNVDFRVLEESAVDAFASPETITMTTGMLRFLRSEDELAVVLGHELAHITRGHAVGRVGLHVPGVILGVLASFVVPGSQKVVTTVAEKVAASLIRGALTKVDRDMERQADVYGLVYAYLAGYDPRAASRVWERFAVELPSSMTATLFAIHPPSTERLIRLQKMTEALLAGTPVELVLEGARPGDDKALPAPAPLASQTEGDSAPDVILASP